VALIEQGYDGSYNGDAYGSVMYQNENVSVRVSDKFMEAALEGREWWTRRVTDGQPCERKDARVLLRKIAEGTYICGDPGMQFDPRFTNGIPARARTGKTPLTRVRSISSSITPHAIWPRSI